jgi:hypothetical protein
MVERSRRVANRYRAYFLPDLTTARFRQALKPAFAALDLDELADHVRHRTQPKFFFSSNLIGETRLFFRAQLAEDLAARVELADQFCRHVFDLLGSGPTVLGPEINWHCDFLRRY